MRTLIAGVLLAGGLAGGLAAAVVPGGPEARITAPDVVLDAGESAVVPVDVALAASPPRLDVVVLLDASTSMTRQLPDVVRQLDDVLGRAAAAGDVQVGVAVSGTTPRPPSPVPADPARDPSKPAYRPPVLFRRLLPVGPWTAARTAMRAVSPEVLPTGDDLSEYDRERLHGALLGVHALVTGSGYDGTASDRRQDGFPAGQSAGWRPGAARLLVTVTDRPLDPIGTVTVTEVASELRQAGVVHLGLVAGHEPAAVLDLARLTSARVPVGGLRCGGFRGDLLLPAGAPLVCGTRTTALAVQTVARTVPRRLRLALAAGPHDGTFRGLVTPVAVLDAAVATVTRVGVQLRCPSARAVSTHRLPLLAAVDGIVAGRGELTLRCEPIGAEARRPPPARAAGSALPEPPAVVLPATPVPPVAIAPQPAVLPQQAVQPGTALGVAVMPETEQAAAYARDDEGSAALELLLAASLVSGLLLLVTRTRPGPAVAKGHGSRRPDTACLSGAPADRRRLHRVRPGPRPGAGADRDPDRG